MSADGIVNADLAQLQAVELSAFNAHKADKEMSIEEQAREYTRYHAATDPQIEKMRAVREATENLLVQIVRNCPRNADRSAAIRKARECLMTANASIVLPPLSL